jgi:hypothetical protein
MVLKSADLCAAAVLAWSSGEGCCASAVAPMASAATKAIPAPAMARIFPLFLIM